MINKKKTHRVDCDQRGRISLQLIRPLLQIHTPCTFLIIFFAKFGISFSFLISKGIFFANYPLINSLRVSNHFKDFQAPFIFFNSLSKSPTPTSKCQAKKNTISIFQPHEAKSYSCQIHHLNTSKQVICMV